MPLSNEMSNIETACSDRDTSRTVARLEPTDLAVVLSQWLCPMDEVLAIYPTARKVEQVLKEQSRAGARLGHRVLTFPQLVNYFANELPARLPLITPIGERMALSEALSRVKTRHSVQASTGLIAHMVRLIRELKSSALTHEDFHRSVRTLSDPPAGVLL